MTNTNNYFILTGSMGSGKSTMLNEVSSRGITVINEPARQILAEQRSFAGQGVPETNPCLFTELLLSRSIHLYEQAEQLASEFIIFDRGIADNVSYANLFQIDAAHYLRAARSYRCNINVFILPAWEEIYTTDEERKMSYQESYQFGEHIKQVYTALNYNLIEVPKIDANLRAQFILDKISEIRNG